jgi:hypothetical protein
MSLALPHCAELRTQARSKIIREADVQLQEAS